MNPSVRTCRPEETAAEAARRMRDRGVGCLVVVEDERPVGMITDRDLVVRTLARGEDPEKVPVRECMTEPLITAPRGLSVVEATRRMRGAGIRRLPLVDEEERLCGILTADSLIGTISGQLQLLHEAVQKRLRVGESAPSDRPSVLGKE